MRRIIRVSRIAPLLVLLAVSWTACGGRATDPAATTPADAERVALTSSDPVIVHAREGEEPGEVHVTLINQVGKNIPIDPRFFALLAGSDPRGLRPFDPTADTALMASSVLPTDGQAVLLLRFAVDAPLRGQKLVLNPEPLGIRPSYAIIQPAEPVRRSNVTEIRLDDTGAGQRY